MENHYKGSLGSLKVYFCNTSLRPLKSKYFRRLIKSWFEVYFIKINFRGIQEAVKNQNADSENKCVYVWVPQKYTFEGLKVPVK